MLKRRFPFVRQLDSNDCGPACLAMVMRYYGKAVSLQKLRERTYITRGGVTMLALSDCAESMGMRSIGASLTTQRLASEAGLPCIAHWRQKHFVVIYKIKNDKVFIADPGAGLVSLSREDFTRAWANEKGTEEEQGFCLFLEPTPGFYAAEDEEVKKLSFGRMFGYIRPYKGHMFQIMLGMVLGSLLMLIYPFLTQAVVDFGINNRDINFIVLILAAQLTFNISRAISGLIQSWIMLHVTTRVTIHLISDFLIKLLKLPLNFFDTRMIGDILQRIGDHQRIQSFLTSTSLNIIFSLANLVIFAIVLAIYNVTIFLIFVVGSAAYIAWLLLFMKKRRELDYKRFTFSSQNQSSIIQLIGGIQEIKLNNCEKLKRWDWERIQARLFKVSIKGMYLVQYQQSGSMLINQVKGLLISFFTAAAVIDGKMTLGMMLAVQAIIGQLGGPIEQIISFFQSAQDAKISMERLGEIHLKEDEESSEAILFDDLPRERSLQIKQVSFQYGGPHSDMVLRDLDLVIPEKKITAIVGVSGSGKTTLIKLLLRFYVPSRGDIKVGDIPLDKIRQRVWRANCGVVMQDGYIFSDSVAQNIALGAESVDKERVLYAAKVANIGEFIGDLPLGYNTKIGAEGQGLSQGQRQRILIARAVYKNPAYLFFDEATNSLDANNEETIMKNLEVFFRERTVIIVAHRLSTVKQADQIVVLDKGSISEVGPHPELISAKRIYYNLIKNQLELGN